MLQRLYEVKEPLAAALASLTTDIVLFTSEDFESITQCIGVLKPFHQARLRGGKKRVSWSKVIPMICILKHSIASKRSKINPAGDSLTQHVNNNLGDKFAQVKTLTALSHPTLLDPRFK